MMHFPTTALLACCAMAGLTATVRLQAPAPPASAPADATLAHHDEARSAAAAGDVERVLEQLRRALADDAAERRTYARARLEVWALQWCEEQVQRHLAAREFEPAGELLVRVREALRSEFAQQRLERLERRLDEAAERELRDGDDPEHDRLLRRLDAYAGLLDRADADLQRARTNSRRTVESARRAEAALRRYEAVERDVSRRLAGRDPADAGTAQLVAVQMRAGDGAVRAMLQLAEARTTQGDFRNALQWVDRVQQRDASHREAEELRRTIQIASAAAAAWLGPLGAPGGLQ